MKKLTHDEPFLGIPEGMRATVGDFWAWAFSDLLNNTLRGTLAEYIVAAALGISDGIRIDWEPYDLTYRGIKIEVKSSAFLQSWTQNGKLATASFGIKPTKAWTSDSHRSDEKRRQSDVYVFCLFTETRPDSANPLDLNQWRFYVVPTYRLNSECGEQKSASLSTIQRLCPEASTFSTLKSDLERASEGFLHRDTQK